METRFVGSSHCALLTARSQMPPRVPSIDAGYSWRSSARLPKQRGAMSPSILTSRAAPALAVSALRAAVVMALPAVTPAASSDGRSARNRIGHHRWRDRPSALRTTSQSSRQRCCEAAPPGEASARPFDGNLGQLSGRREKVVDNNLPWTTLPWESYHKSTSGCRRSSSMHLRATSRACVRSARPSQPPRRHRGRPRF